MPSYVRSFNAICNECDKRFAISNRFCAVVNLDIDGFEINFMASAPDSPYVGIPLNINQGLHFKNMVLTLPEGVFVNMNEL